MNEKVRLNTVFCAAFGAALGYYAFKPFLTAPLARNFALPALLAALMIIALLLALPRLLRAPRLPRLPPGLPPNLPPAAPSAPAAAAITAASDVAAYSQKRRALFCAAFAAGLGLGTAALCAAGREAALRFGLPKNEVTGLAGTLLDDPRSSNSGRGMATLSLNESAGYGGVRTSASGRVMVFFAEEAMPRLKEFGRGSKVFLEGSFASANTSKNTAAHNTRPAMFKAKSTHITAPSSALNALRTKIRRGLTSIFDGGEGGKKHWGGLALALLLGIKDSLDGEIAAKYRDAGCSYILALSGMHLAIVSSIVAFLLKKPLGVRPAAVIGAAFIVIYIYLVGGQPSLVRAGIAALIGAFSLLCSFSTGALHLLALSFLTQLVIDPPAGGSISFILSYLALAGILISGKPIEGVLRGRLPAFIAQPLSASLGAFLATMAVTAVFFGGVRAAGIVAGLVMVPLTTVFMIGSIIFLTFQAVLPLLSLPLAAFACRPLDIALSFLYMILEKTAKTAASLPALPVFNLPIFVTISCALPFIITILCARHVKKRNFVPSLD